MRVPTGTGVVSDAAADNPLSVQYADESKVRRCRYAPREVCGGCGVCRDFHDYHGRGCTDDSCPYGPWRRLRDFAAAGQLTGGSVASL